jgi:hypothetical protein
MRATTLLTWLRRQVVIDQKTAAISLTGGLVGPLIVAGLQVVTSVWAERLVTTMTLLAR